VRAKHLDDWTREFLAAHRRATVLHLGCGLDSRVFRVSASPVGRFATSAIGSLTADSGSARASTPSSRRRSRARSSGSGS
jgi:hypothetical protein